MQLDTLGLSGSPNTLGAELDANTYALWRADEATLGVYYTLADSGSQAASMSGGTVANTPRVCPGPVVGKRARQIGSVTYNGLVNNATPGGLAATFQGDWTIEAYVFLDAVSAGCLYCYGASGETQATNVQSSLWVTAGGKLQTKWETGSGTDRITTQVAGGSLSAGTWYHIAVVKTGGNVLYYIDGVLQDTVAYAANADGGSSAYHYGFGHELGANPWIGRCAGLQISNTARSAGALLANYNLMATTALMNSDANTICYWQCEDAADMDDSAGRLPLCTNSSLTDVMVAAPMVNPQTGYSRYIGANTGQQRLIQAAAATAVPPWATSLCTLLRGDFSIEVWVFPTAGAARPLIGLTGTGSSPAKNGWSWSLSSSGNNWAAIVSYQYGAVPTVETYTTGTLFTLNEVMAGNGVLVAVTKISDVYRHYVNGVLKDTSTARPSYDGTGVTGNILGIGQDISGNSYVGRVDDMRLSSVGRSVTELLATYTRGAGGGVVAKRPHP